MTIPVCECMCDRCVMHDDCTTCTYITNEPAFREVHPVTNAEDEAALLAAKVTAIDPWDEVPATWQGTMPRWILDNARLRDEEPDMTADDLVAWWIENMYANAYDMAREDGVYPCADCTNLIMHTHERTQP